MFRGLYIGIVLLALLGSGNALAAKPLAERIGRADRSQWREATGVHAGAGSMRYSALLGTDALSTNLIFLHSGELGPKSGIGQHFHNQCEEMFVILDGEAEFTIDGRTTMIAGPAGAPDRAGHSHGIYNPTDRPVRWLNINVGQTKAYDAFDMGDDRVGAAKDKVAQFMAMRLDRALLKPAASMDGGQGIVMYRRALEPTVFTTAWSYVDHITMPPGSTIGPLAKPDMSEVVYVISGQGEVSVDGKTVPFREGDAIPIDLGETRSLRQTGPAMVELMVIGVAKDLDAKARFRAATAPRRR